MNFISFDDNICSILVCHRGIISFNITYVFLSFLVLLRCNFFNI